jgi:hypothetical protein
MLSCIQVKAIEKTNIWLDFLKDIAVEPPKGNTTSLQRIVRHARAIDLAVATSSILNIHRSVVIGTKTFVRVVVACFGEYICVVINVCKKQLIIVFQTL